METTVDINTILLECIDGKDDHFRIAIENNKNIVFSCSSDNGSIQIHELASQSGGIIFYNVNGHLYIDASGCSVEVKVNGNIISKTYVVPADLLRIGSSIWKFYLPYQPQSAVKTVSNIFSQQFTNIIGLEGLKDFKFKDIFSQVFKKHSLVETENQLMTGTYHNIPAITDIETGWAKPWLFSRLLFINIVLVAVLMIGFKAFSNPNLIPGTIFLGCFAMPLCTLIFYLEMNAPRNISIFMVMALVFTGGIASLTLALIFFAAFPFLEKGMGASSAGIIEESAKVIIVVLLLGRLSRYKWLLNGLLFGAAIGAGFGAFESAGYAFKPFMQGVNLEAVSSMDQSIMIRGVLAPFMHIVWTGNAVAALWLVKGSLPFRLNMLADFRFLRVMLSSMVLHIVWNASFTTIEIPVFLDLKYPVLGVIAWMICFRLIQTGLKQLNEARRLEVERLTAT